MADHAEIHFTSGEKIEVPGTVSEIQSALVSGRGGRVTFKDRDGADVSINPEHVTYVQGAPVAD